MHAFATPETARQRWLCSFSENAIPINRMNANHQGVTMSARCARQNLSWNSKTTVVRRRRCCGNSVEPMFVGIAIAKLIWRGTAESQASERELIMSQWNHLNEFALNLIQFRLTNKHSALNSVRWKNERNWKNENEKLKNTKNSYFPSNERSSSSNDEMSKNYSIFFFLWKLFLGKNECGKVWCHEMMSNEQKKRPTNIQTDRENMLKLHNIFYTSTFVFLVAVVDCHRSFFPLSFVFVSTSIFFCVFLLCWSHRMIRIGEKVSVSFTCKLQNIREKLIL